MAVQCWAQTARCRNALGDLAAARDAYQKGRAAGARLTAVSPQLLQLVSARDEMCLALDENWEKEARSHESFFQNQNQSFAVTWFQAAFRAGGAKIYAHLGKHQQALDELKHAIVPLERAPGGAPNYPRMACDAAATLWMLERSDHIELIERNLREKVIAPDFRYPMADGRLSLARLCALQGRYDEAAEWFAKSRAVLEEQGARPLRALADFDEAWMYLRRNAPGDIERARPLLDGAMAQFKSIGMTGWLRRVEKLMGASG
jgi:tetratricopeptide (TPR) repeat protein